jgi:hypothetical protein
MSRDNSSLFSWVERLVPWFFLFLLLTFLYAKLFVIPYTGFHLTSSGAITGVFAGDTSLLFADDVITRVNETPWEELRADPWRLLFPDAAAGSILNLTILRGGVGEPIEVAWEVPGRNFIGPAARLAVVVVSPL